MKTQGYLGIDIGTQGLSVIFTDANLKILATGEAGYEMVSGLAPECFEQTPAGRCSQGNARGVPVRPDVLVCSRSKFN